MAFAAGEIITATKLNRLLPGESGIASVTITSGTSSSTITVTFSKPFTSTPSVTAQINSAAGAVIGGTILMTGVTNTSATLRVAIPTNAASTLTFNVHWQAVGQ